MAVSFDLFRVLEGYEMFGPGKSLLDIGTSNLYNVDFEQLITAFKKYGQVITSEVADFANEIASGGGRAENGAALNRAWLGQLVEGIGMEYDSIDIAAGYKTRLIDLNQRSIPANMLSSYDVVLNCGTTEHILNQYNAFKCIHDATTLGGFMFHQVPATGHTDHGYFTYTSRFFLDLAGYNDYQLVDFWLEGPDGHDKMFTGARSYKDVFPLLGHVLDRIGTNPRETRIDALEIANISQNVLFRKKDDRPFMGMVEISTSWGEGGAHDVGAAVGNYAR